MKNLKMYEDNFLDTICYGAFINLYSLSKEKEKICLYKFYGDTDRSDHLALLWCASLVQQIYGYPIYIECTRREAHKIKQIVPIKFKRMPKKFKKDQKKNCDEIIYDLECANQAFGAFDELYYRYWKIKENT